MTRRKDAPPSQVKGNIMKNNTFDQIINSDLTSIDPGLRPVRTRQGLCRPDEEGPQQVRPLPRREARRRRHSTSPLFFPILKSHSGRPRFQTESRPPAFHVRRLPLLNSEIAGGGAFAWAARHVEADCHDDEHHRAADPQHTAAERVENPTSDQRRERVRQRPHQVV